ncbi:hypothetical protein ACFORL_10165 [Legionella dresdenensis]|uniref:Substrate of the Dot/Icm secretion system n=1 Tax=Legionella dresdenensis TaxID=450200 RepID=A0ABV8CGR5_9GAMM
MVNRSSPPNRKITSEKLHNKNCWRFIHQLTIPWVMAEQDSSSEKGNHIQVKPSDVILSRFQAKDPELCDELYRVLVDAEYHADHAYADLYKRINEYVEENITLFIPGTAKKPNEAVYKETIISQLTNQNSRESSEHSILENFIASIYNNNNDILELAYDTLKEVIQEHRPVNQRLTNTISRAIADHGVRINKHSISPADAGSLSGRFRSLVSPNFKPQHTTSLPTIKNYRYKTQQKPIEYRIGTQGQRHNGEERVSPLFIAWLDIQRKNAVPTKISHIYFNNLGLDREHHDIEGSKEKKLSTVLHRLEEKFSNLVVITLPADKGIMSEEHCFSTKKEIPFQNEFNRIINIAYQRNTSKFGANDFYISPRARKLLFCDENDDYSPQVELEILQNLLNNSIARMGLSNQNLLSRADCQAIWVDFTKFALPDYIIRTLNPDGFNFSCKDAIDRAASSSIYYNLMKSIEADEPLTREEFERGLHAAAIVVKGRGMNHHINLVWNAINSYVNTNYDSIEKNPQLKWLITWRDFNCPPERVEELLPLRIQQCSAQLQKIKNSNNKKAISKGLEVQTNMAQMLEYGESIIEDLNKQNKNKVSGKCLLLEIVSMTPEVVTNPTNRNLNEYARAAQQATIRFPRLQYYFSGFMIALFRLLYYPTCGYTNSFIKSWSATREAGNDAITRKHMISLINNLKNVGEQMLQGELNQTGENLANNPELDIDSSSSTLI